MAKRKKRRTPKSNQTYELLVKDLNKEVPQQRVITSLSRGQREKIDQYLNLRTTPVCWGIPCDEVMYTKFFTMFIRQGAMPWDDFATSESTYLPDISNVVIREADFSGKTLKGVIFTNAVLRNSIFDFCDLNGADFSGADLSNSRFHGSKLEKANFTKSNMYLSYIMDVFLDETKFIETILLWARLKNMNLALAKIEGTIFSWVLMENVKLTPTQFLSLPPDVLETIKMVNSDMPVKKDDAGTSTAPKYGSGNNAFDMPNKYSLPDNLYVVTTAADTYKDLRNLYGK